jgi:beta-galactosidase
MKKLTLLSCIAFFLGAALMAQSSEGQLRQTQLFNFGWKFHFGEAKDAHQPSFDDKTWRKLDLPHDFQFDQPWLEDGDRARGFKAMGEGWYRKSFKANADWKGKKVIARFRRHHAHWRCVVEW